MTHQNDYNLSGKSTEMLLKNGLDSLSELIRILVNRAMQEKRNRFL